LAFSGANFNHVKLGLYPTAVNEINSFITSIYPNPAHTNINVRIESQENARVIIDILDMSGRQLNISELHTLSNGSHILPIEISHLQQGAYIVRIKLNETVRTLPLIKQ
jgi:hypothetical protein